MLDLYAEFARSKADEIRAERRYRGELVAFCRLLRQGEPTPDRIEALTVIENALTSRPPVEPA